MMAWWKRFGRRAATLLLTVLMLLGTAAGEGADKTVINRINAPDVSADFAFAEDADLLEIIFPQILDCDAAFLRCGGETMLIDCATSGQAQRILNMFKQLGITHVDKIVNTHPHADHLGAAAEVVRGFRVKNVYMPDVAHTSKTYLDLLDALEADESVSVRRAVAGESFSIGEVTFDILSPIEDKYADLNLYSAVLRVTYREKRFLLMGDAEQPNETALLASGESLRADLLKVGHHGSSTSSSADFLRAVRPDCALISCGEGNSYGHPEQVVLDRLEAIGAAVYRTDRDGTIRAVCDGKTIEITTERTS